MDPQGPTNHRLKTTAPESFIGWDRGSDKNASKTRQPFSFFYHCTCCSHFKAGKMMINSRHFIWKNSYGYWMTTCKLPVTSFTELRHWKASQWIVEGIINLRVSSSQPSTYKYIFHHDTVTLAIHAVPCALKAGFSSQLHHCKFREPGSDWPPARVTHIAVLGGAQDCSISAAVGYISPQIVQEGGEVVPTSRTYTHAAQAHGVGQPLGCCKVYRPPTLSPTSDCGERDCVSWDMLPHLGSPCVEIFHATPV